MAYYKIYNSKNAVVNQGTGWVTVASADTIGLENSNCFNVTGTTAITKWDTSTLEDGTIVILKFASTVTINHDTNEIYLQGATNFTTSANDILTFVIDGTTLREISRTNN